MDSYFSRGQLAKKELQKKTLIEIITIFSNLFQNSYKFEGLGMDPVDGLLIGL